VSDFPLGVNPVPLWGNILVKLLDNVKETAGGIIVPETVVNRPVQGVVKEVSQGEFVMEGAWVTHQTHVGDVVIFNWKSGFDLVLDNENYRIIHEKDVISILRGVNYGE
jgi:chaperonin GroES